MIASTAAGPSPPPAPNGRARLIAIMAALACALAALAAWWSGLGTESTDDAHVQAEITLIAPRIAGTVVHVAVQDNQIVQAGDLLFELDRADAEARERQAVADLAAAEARVQTARAELEITRKQAPALLAETGAAVRAAKANAERARLDTSRYQALYERNEIPLQLLDQARASSHALQAQAEGSRAQQRAAATLDEQLAAREAALASASAVAEQARSGLEQARLQLSYTCVTAPSAGTVTRKNVYPGTQIAAGAPALALVGNTPWVVANFKETQLEDMRTGQPVEIEIDAFPGQVFHGRVESLQAGTGSVFSLLPPENASGNFVKVVQRVPVKIVFDPPPPAHLRLAAGLSAIPTVDVRESSGSALAAAP
ncbi:MAG: HlyD family secretion protein [Panacagrimonas sp.]